MAEHVKARRASALQRRGGEDHIIGVPRIVDARDPNRVRRAGVSKWDEGNEDEEQAEGTPTAPSTPDASEDTSQRYDGPYRQGGPTLGYGGPPVKMSDLAHKVK